MRISVVCTGCDKILRVDESKRGRRTKCPACGEVVLVVDADVDVAEESTSTPHAKRRRKKKSAGGNSAALLMGAAVAVVALIAIGFSLQPPKLPAVNPFEQQPGNPPVVTQPLTASATPSALDRSQNPVTNSSATTSGTKAPPPRSVTKEEDEPNATAAAIKASDEFFTDGQIPELRISITEPEMEKLKAGPREFVIGSPRPYVQASIRENGTTNYDNVAIKLKGSAGSFRPVDGRPALTVHVSKTDKKQMFHGLGKFHLNNSVQDETYLHEWLSEELFRAAKIPATRVTHARVWLNDRDLGLYVLKSSFDKSFLQRHFTNAKGNLYEGGFVQDIDSELEKDSGKDPDDRRDLTALLEACREPDAETRWERVREHLNVDQFVSFMAMEMMVGHWDGYTLNHNNYRLYFDASQKKGHFLPHGMDQVFGNPGASIIDFPSSIVSSSVMLNGEWRALYRQRIGELITLFSPTDSLLKRIDVVNDRLRPVLAKMSPQAAKDHDDRVNNLKERIVQRVANLIQQQSQADPQPADFDESGRLKISEWYAVSESPEAKLEAVDLPKGIRAYSILCGPKSQCNSSWRCKTLLAKGTYLLHARMKTNAILATDEKTRAVGAGIRISGMTRSNVRKGTVNWIPVEYEFTVIEDVRKIEFVAELQARKGQVWFDADSLYLTRVATEQN